jgi:DNA-directed RNA polymerase subunit RPC12/RpoP
MKAITFVCIECKKEIDIKFESKDYKLVCQKCAR